MSMWAFVLCTAAVLVLTLIPTQPPVVTTGWDKSNAPVWRPADRWGDRLDEPFRMKFTLGQTKNRGNLILDKTFT